MVRSWIAASVLIVHVGCGRAPEQRIEQITVWKPLGSWSGHGVLQTDAFISDTGLLRLVWEARASSGREPGTLRVAVHSAVSGRLLVLAVDQRGAGRNTQYVTEDPRSFFLLIESTGLDWSVEVAEGITAERRAAVPGSGL